MICLTLTAEASVHSGWCRSAEVQPVLQGQGMVKLKSLDRSSSSRPWFGKQDKSQMQQMLQEKDATIEALQVCLGKNLTIHA